MEFGVPLAIFVEKLRRRTPQWLMWVVSETAPKNRPALMSFMACEWRQNFQQFHPTLWAEVVFQPFPTRIVSHQDWTSIGGMVAQSLLEKSRF